MESLDKEWILHGNTQNCEQFEKTPNTLGLKNMAGVFILVGAGIIGGICLIIIEVVYKKHQIKKQKRIELARHAADKWRGTIEVSYFTINRVVISPTRPICTCFMWKFDICVPLEETKNTESIIGYATAIQRWNWWWNMCIESGYNQFCRR